MEAAQGGSRLDRPLVLVPERVDHYCHHQVEDNGHADNVVHDEEGARPAGAGCGHKLVYYYVPGVCFAQGGSGGGVRVSTTA